MADTVKAIQGDPTYASQTPRRIEAKSFRFAQSDASESIAAFENFKLQDFLNHPLLQQSDTLLTQLAEAAGWPAALRRRLVEGVHARFRPTFHRIVADGKAKEKFDPLIRLMHLAQTETNNFMAIERHIEYQLWRFNQAPVLGKKSSPTESELTGIQCPLKDIYVPLDAGTLRWGEILQLQKTDDRTGTWKSPFDESVGGRNPILAQVIQFFGDRNFRDALVVQGVAGAGKSAFTLNLCVELRNLGLRPIRIRMRDLALDPRMPLLEDLAQAIAQNSGDDAFDRLGTLPRIIAKDLDVSQLFHECIEFGDARICPHVLIFDGWDEISVSASEGFRQRIEDTLRSIRREIVNGAPNKVRVVLTGRPSLDVEESRFLQSETPVLTVRPFTAGQLKRFSDALLDYRLKIKPGDRADLENRIKTLIKRSQHTSQSDAEGKLGILGLPLLALLANWLTLNDEVTSEVVGADRTALYRRLVDMTCRHGGNVEEIAAGPRIVGEQLRELLRRTAAAMTMRGTENISYTELERRLNDSGAPARDDTIRNAMRDNPIANLMISFFFNVGSREHGCEFIHKSFREYLFSECIVETLKNIAEELQTSHLRTPYWKDFDDSDPRRKAIRRLALLLAPQWLMPDVARHLLALLAWEIGRAPDDDSKLTAPPQNETRPLSLEKWSKLRDLLADLWDWWAEGVHLRPQPYIRDDTRVLDYRDAFAVWLARTIAPVDFPREQLPEPRRVLTIDAHLGDALFRLNCTVHFEINKATGWLDQSGQKKTPALLWANAQPNAIRRYQTLILNGPLIWVAFAPSSPDNKNHYIFQYSSRINAAGWRPEGYFPTGVDISGVDLAGAQWQGIHVGGITCKFARLSGAAFDQSHFGHFSDFSSSLADGISCHLCAGGNLNFSDCDLSRGIFIQSIFWETNFLGAVVKAADFTGAELARVDRTQLKGAGIERVSFKGRKPRIQRGQERPARAAIPRPTDT